MKIPLRSIEFSSGLLFAPRLADPVARSARDQACASSTLAAAGAASRHSPPRTTGPASSATRSRASNGPGPRSAMRSWRSTSDWTTTAKRPAATMPSFSDLNYGASVVGYTVSREQWAWAKERHAKLAVDVRLDDYRKATGSYDAVVSIGLMEHVGTKNYRAYMELATRCLAPGGIVFIHTIGGQEPRAQIDPWYHKYIFPNAAIPTLGQLAAAMDQILVVEDVHNLGPDYDRTLMAWWANFDQAWPSLRAQYGDHFYRMWKFYLMTSAAQFRARALNLFQIAATATGTKRPPSVRES